MGSVPHALAHPVILDGADGVSDEIVVCAVGTHI